MAAKGQVEVKIGADDSDLEKALKGVKGKAESTIGKIGKVATGATKAIAAISGAVVAAGGFIAKMGMDFESAFAQVQTIMDPTEKSIEDMKTEILALSEATGVAASELSGSVYNAISATGDTANAVTLVESATKLATAGFTDTESALGVITTAMNAYGLSAEEATKISDSLVQTQNLGVTTIAQLSSSMGKAIASASAYGIDLYNVEAAYVAMTKSGISTAESTTYMSSMFKELGDSGSSVAKALKQETGQSFDQLMASGASLSDVLSAVYKAAGEDSTALMNMWGSAEAGKAANAIINQGLDSFNENLGNIRESAGTTEAAYDTMVGTLEHQTEALMNSVKNLGVAIYEDYSGEVASLVGEAGGWLSELSEAYSAGGIDALGDTAAAIAPKLINTLLGVAQKAISGVSAKLPALIKNLMSAVPSALHAIVEIAPTITDAFFEAFSAGIEALIPMLPGIIGDLVNGIDTMLGSVVRGIGMIMGGMFNGIEQAFHEGQTKLFSGDWIDSDQVENVSYRVRSDVQLEETGLTAEDVIEKVEGTRNAIREALGGIEGIDAEEVANSIISGDVSAAVEAALIGMGVDAGQAEQVAASIRAANEVITSAISELGLTDDQAAGLNELAANGATKEQIEAYLTSCEIEPEAASNAAESITTARTTMETAINGLPEGVSGAMSGLDFTSDKAILAAALAQLELDGSEIENVLASYESVSGSLTAGVATIFDSITKTLTDGEADTPELMAGLEEQVKGWAREAYEQIELWYADELQNLQDSGLSGDEYESKLGELNSLKDGYISQVEEAEAATVGLIGSSAGKVGAELEAALTEIDAAEQRITSLSGQLDALTAKTNQAASANQGAYQAVRAGVAEETVVEQAISFKYTEFKVDMKGAKDAYDSANNQLLEKLSAGEINADEYKDLVFGEDGIKTAMEAEQEVAKQQFAQGITEMAEGLASASGVAPEMMASTIRDMNLGTIMEEALAEGVEGDWISNSDVQTEFKSNIAKMFNIDPNDPEFGQKLKQGFEGLGEIGQPLAEALQHALDTGDYSAFGLEWQKLSNALVEGSAEGMDKLETGPFGANIKKWIEQGVFDGLEQFSNEDGSVDFASVLRGLMSGSGDPIEVPVQTELTPEDDGNTESNVSEYVEETKNDVEDRLKAEGADTEYTAHATVTSEVTQEEGNAEEVAEQVAEQTEEALQTTDGETVVIAQNANVQLNVTATVTGTDFNSAGAEAAAQFAQGITSGQSAASGAAAGMGAAAITYLRTANSAAQTLGLNFAQGYARGIAAGTNSAVNAAVALAAAAIAAVKSTQNSSSPSKVTAGLGRNFGEGYEIGIRESMQNAVNTAKMMTGEILNASVIGSSGLGVLRVEAGGEPLQVAMEGADKPVYLDGVQIASIQGGNNASQLAWQNNRSARGVGK